MNTYTYELPMTFKSFIILLVFNSAVNSIKNCEKPLSNIQEQLKNALFLSQQIKYEHTRR